MKNNIFKREIVVSFSKKISKYSKDSCYGIVRKLKKAHSEMIVKIKKLWVPPYASYSTIEELSIPKLNSFIHPAPFPKEIIKQSTNVIP